MPGRRTKFFSQLVRGGEPVQDEKDNSQDIVKDEPFRVRLPGFISDEEIGLGDAVKRMTYAMGIKPCGGCAARAATLNRWVVFTR
jgi:hypothetical protein